MPLGASSQSSPGLQNRPSGAVDDAIPCGGPHSCQHPERAIFDNSSHVCGVHTQHWGHGLDPLPGTSIQRLHHGPDRNPGGSSSQENAATDQTNSICRATDARSAPAVSTRLVMVAFPRLCKTPHMVSDPSVFELILVTPTDARVE